MVQLETRLSKSRVFGDCKSQQLLRSPPSWTVPAAEERLRTWLVQFPTAATSTFKKAVTDGNDCADDSIVYNDDMDINGVIIRKLESLDATLGELRSLGTVNVKKLQDDWRTKKAIERNLQVLVEIVIDVCQRLLSVSGQTPATSGMDAIQRCIQLGILSEYAAYRKMVQFRNFIVHRYEQVDDEILASMVNRYLGDFERFRVEIMAYVKGH